MVSSVCFHAAAGNAGASTCPKTPSARMVVPEPDGAPVAGSAKVPRYGHTSDSDGAQHWDSSQGRRPRTITLLTNCYRTLSSHCPLTLRPRRADGQNLRLGIEYFRVSDTNAVSRKVARLLVGAIVGRHGQAQRGHVPGGVIDDPEAKHARAFGLDMAPRNRRTFLETALICSRWRRSTEWRQ